LTDVYHDVRQASSSIPDSTSQQNVSAIYESIADLLTDVTYSQNSLCHTFLSKLSSSDKFRVVMVQLLLSQAVSPKIEERQTLCLYLFGSKQNR